MNSANKTSPQKDLSKKDFKLKSRIIFALFFVLFAGCGGGEELTSTWNDAGITVDGQASEWTSHLWYLKNEHLSLGIRNDGEYAYLCITSSEDQFRREMMGLGLTVWFESAKGGKIGIHYPLGRTGRGRGARGERGEAGATEGAGGAEAGATSGAFTDANDFQEAELLGPRDEDKQHVSIVQLKGVNVKIGSANGSVVYELRVPLASTSEHPFAIGAEIPSEVKLSIATGKFEGGGGSRQGGGGGGGRGGGRRGGGGGGRRGGGGGGMGAGGGDEPGEGGTPPSPPGGRPEPIDFHATVHLVKAQ